jgi:hypothetical protein
MEEGTNGQMAYLPCEIKSMSPQVFDSINTVKDFEKYPWTRKYYGQIQVYLKNDSGFFPYGYFLAKNKSTGEIKLIKDYDGSNTIKFNEPYWNALVARGKLVNEFVFNNKMLKMKIAKAKTQKTKDKLTAQLSYPDRIKYDLKVCKGCKYEHICISDLTSSIGSVVDNPSIIEAVEDWVKAKANVEQFKQADKDYKQSLATLKSLFPLEDSLYRVGEKYLVETKKRKIKDTEYLAFDYSKVEQTENDGKQD